MEPKNSTKKSAEPAAVSNILDIQFPDWSGMDDSSARITAEAAFRLSEEYPALRGALRAELRPQPSNVEFVL